MAGGSDRMYLTKTRRTLNAGTSNIAPTPPLTNEDGPEQASQVIFHEQTAARPYLGGGLTVANNPSSPYASKSGDKGRTNHGHSTSVTKVTARPTSPITRALARMSRDGLPVWA